MEMIAAVDDLRTALSEQEGRRLAYTAADILITEIFADATRAGEKARLRTIKDLDEAAGRLGQVCALLLDPSVADSALREAVFAVVKRRFGLTTPLSLLVRVYRDPRANHREISGCWTERQRPGLRFSQRVTYR